MALTRGKMELLASVPYPDGVVVRIDQIRNRVESGHGPGSYDGRAYVTVTLTVVNRSTTPIDLNEVVVTATYGSPALVAPPVYEDPKAVDFFGAAAPGASVSATYAFAIPPKNWAGAALQVDLDAAHDPAIFGGAR